jgi:hypothetical protein
MRTLLSILVIPLLVVGCVGAGAGGSPLVSTDPSGAPSTAPTTTARYAVETGADKLVLRLSVDGGFAGFDYLLTKLPIVALYGDGRVIIQGPTITTYPSPLPSNLRQIHVSPAEIQQILAAADAAGLLGPDTRYDATNVSDAGTTTFRTIENGKPHIIGAYALREGGAADDAAVMAARAKLIDFSNKITDLSKFLGRTLSDAEAYSPTQMRIFVNPLPADDPNFPNRHVITWPLAVDPRSGEETTRPGVTCLVVGGENLAAFLKAATDANGLTTVWSAPSGLFSVSVRPLYPDESGCMGAAR